MHLVFFRGDDGHDGEALVDIYHGLGEAMGADEQLHPCSCARVAREVDEEEWNMKLMLKLMTIWMMRSIMRMQIMIKLDFNTYMA